MSENPLGKPEWVNKRKLVRALQAALGAVAGLFLCAAGIIWGYISDDGIPLWERIAVAAAACATGLIMGLGIAWMAYHVG